jgi:oligoribonuclease
MPQGTDALQSNNALIWIDLEMTGLNPETDRIIELAMIITDSQLNVIAEGPAMAVRQTQAVLDGMDDWNKRTHTQTGLLERVKASTMSELDVEGLALEFAKKYVTKNKSPMCGSSICQDRRFLARLMPELEAWFHYRNLDVSALKELMLRWRPELANGLVKKNTHKALDDIRESIQELDYYRTHFLKMKP